MRRYFDLAGIRCQFDFQPRLQLVSIAAQTANSVSAALWRDLRSHRCHNDVCVSVHTLSPTAHSRIALLFAERWPTYTCHVIGMQSLSSNRHVSVGLCMGKEERVVGELHATQAQSRAEDRQQQRDRHQPHERVGCPGHRQRAQPNCTVLRLCTARSVGMKADSTQTGDGRVGVLP